MLASIARRLSRSPLGVAGLGAGTLFVAGHAAQTGCKPAPSLYAGADSLFEANKYGDLVVQLRQAVSANPEDPELLWRLGRACKKLADNEAPKSASKKALIAEGFTCTERALTLSEQCGPVHKWHAILLSESGQFEGTSATIKNSFIVREHFEHAIALSPKDATARHLLGLWCFEVAKLSWIEQRAAAALFATPPKATFNEAIAHFEAAEEIEPGFYPKNLLMLAQAHAKLGQRAEAIEWHRRCLAAPILTPEDAETRKQAEQLKL